MLSSWFTYLSALLFYRTNQPLIWANLTYAVASIISIFLLGRNHYAGEPGDGLLKSLWEKAVKPRNGSPSPNADNRVLFDAPRRPFGDGDWDWIVLSICFVLGCWLIFATLSTDGDNIQFAIKAWSDFGANLSLSQSMAVGQNFPTEHPFFPGEFVRYHFLFWFQAANLAFLGLNLAWSVNLLSLLSILALVTLIATFGEVLFNSRAAGRLASILFFFASSSLAYIPYLRSQTSVGAAIAAILSQHDFIKTGYPFRGDDWGALSVSVFAYQRHFISAMGILLIVLIFLADLYRRKGAMAAPDNTSGSINGTAETDELQIADNPPKKRNRRESAVGDIKGFVFCGVLIGLMPYWNSAVFVSSAFILGGIFLMMPYRRYLLILIGTTIAVGLPQVLMLKSGKISQTSESLFHAGYTIPDPTFGLVLEYLGWTFGLKWLLILVTLIFAKSGQRRLFAAITTLLAAAFLLQLSTDAFNNHKLLNIWNTFATIYAAYAIWIIAKKSIPGKILAIVLTIGMVFGAIIDLFPVRNDAFISVPYANDRLTTWILENTKTTDVFLSDTLLSHPILFAGRKLYLGNTLFAWTAGYDLTDRENNYRRMFSERNLTELNRLLKENKIDYVAIDEGVRSNGSIHGVNDALYRDNFEKVFEDTEHKYGNLTIYRIASPLHPQ